MHNLIVTPDNYFSTNFDEYKYVITLEPISLIPVKTVDMMIKKIIITARRYDRGVLLTNDMAKGADLVKRNGGYLYDIKAIKKIIHNTKGQDLEQWDYSGKPSPSPAIHFGITASGKNIIYHQGRDDYTLMISKIIDLKGDLS